MKSRVNKFNALLQLLIVGILLLSLISGCGQGAQTSSQPSRPPSSPQREITLPSVEPAKSTPPTSTPSTPEPTPSPTPPSTSVQPSSDVPPTPPLPAAEKFSLFATTLAYNINDGLMGPEMSHTLNDLRSGWSVLRSNTRAVQELLSSLQRIFDSRVELVKGARFSPDREIAGYFTWNVIEPEKGSYDWRLTDLVAQYARKSQIKISAVIQPFASWDQKSAIPSPSCRALDFAWYDYKAGPPNDWSAYQKFLEATVERYKDVVFAWEIGNEYDGECGGFQDNPEGYLQLLKTSYETIKRIDPEAMVLNGGALEFPDSSIRNFWVKFFQLGGGNYLDAFNLHYNNERNGAKSDPSTFLELLNFYNTLIKNQSLAKPLWITEFGTYSGTPSPPPLPSGGGSLLSFPSQSQEFQAAWYFRYSILAFANNAEKIFIDLIGSDDNNVTGAAIYNLQNQNRLFLKTLQTISVKLQGFSEVERIADGQYRFTVGEKVIYALWEGSLPPEIGGLVKVTNLEGEEKLTDAQSVRFSAQDPVLVEI